jgi:S-(hydroxymethyl)glutathione dehydrogenase / alcohol dehydrogenase
VKAAVTRRAGAPFAIEDIHIDRPRDHEVLVDVAASGLCHSDLYVAKRGLGVPMPIVLGHEVAGVVREAGALVTEFAVGDHVTSCLVPSCGRCGNCRGGLLHRCQHPEAIYRRNGEPPRLSHAGHDVAQFWGLSGFAEQILTHENQLIAIPREIPMDRACLLGCAVALGAGVVVDTARVRFGDTVAVFGCGGVGLNAIQAARLSGAARIVGVDLLPANLELALRFGATDVVDASGGQVVNRVRELTRGGADHAFEVSGRPDTVVQAARSLAKGGTAYMVGIHPPDTTADREPDCDYTVNRRSLPFVHAGSANFKTDIPLYADLYLHGRLNLDDLVSDVIKLDKINDAYAGLERGGGVARPVVTF